MSSNKRDCTIGSDEVIRLKVEEINHSPKNVVLSISVRGETQRIIIEDIVMVEGQTLIFSDNQESYGTPVGTLSTVPLEFDKDWGNHEWTR